jgi:hypothetical protein
MRRRSDRLSKVLVLPAKLVAAALVYRDASGLSHATKRIDAGKADLRKALLCLERRFT